METNQQKEKNDFFNMVLTALIAIALILIFFFDKKSTQIETQQQPKEQSADNNTTVNEQLETAKEAALNSPDFTTYLNLGNLYYKANNFEKCIEVSRIALKFSAADDLKAIAYSNMCAAYNQIHQPDSAILACGKALLLKPDFDLAKNNMNWAKQEKEKQKQR